MDMDNGFLAQFKHAFRRGVHFIYRLLLEKFRLIFEREKGRRLYARSHPPLVKLVDFDRVQFAIFIQSHGAIEDHILRHGNWSGDLLLLTSHFITPGSAIVEIGANIGFESLYYAKKHPECVVHSYEPGNYAYHSLSLSKAYNRLGNLLLFKLGVGDRNQTLEIASPTESSKNKGLGSFKPNADLDASYRQESIEVVTLDSHFTGDLPISLLKIDTQGFEWNVLQGAANTIARHRPVILFEHEDQYHQDAKEMRRRMSAFFEQAGYDLYLPGEDLLTSLDFQGADHWHGDVLALPRH